MIDMDETYDAKRTEQNAYNPYVASCSPQNCPLKRNSFPSLNDILE